MFDFCVTLYRYGGRQLTDGRLPRGTLCQHPVATHGVRTLPNGQHKLTGRATITATSAADVTGLIKCSVSSAAAWQPAKHALLPVAAVRAWFGQLGSAEWFVWRNEEHEYCRFKTQSETARSNAGFDVKMG